jgi:hypothetical protein
LFDFLSNEEFNFAKSVKNWCANVEMMLPAVACAAFGGGPTL